jgi:hypothetical protein
MIWFAILIPMFAVVVAWVLFKTKIVWWELFIPTLASIVFIVISYYSMKSISLSDVEYNGYIVTEARYYESYNTWVSKTCSEQYACGTYTTGSGKDAVTHTRYCTRYYDCSYCDYNREYYVMIDTKGHEIGISKEKYYHLMKQWSSKQQFVDLNRNIVYHGGCGEDGNMYSIKWDNNPLTSETTTYTKSFTNILKSNHSAFNYPVIEEEKAKLSGLYEYPELLSYNYQPSILGLQKTNLKNKGRITKRLDYLNGKYGKQYKVKVFTLFFVDKDINTAFSQEAYWDGGNQNEIVVCIGLDKSGKLNWVKPFSWCDNKRVVIDIREDLMEAKVINDQVLFDIYYNAIAKNWKYKSFEDFNYLSFEPTTGQLWFVYIFTFLISIGTVWWCVVNEEEH